MIFKWIFINLHQTPMIFMHMALSILCFNLACANTREFSYYYTWKWYEWM